MPSSPIFITSCIPRCLLYVAVFLVLLHPQEAFSGCCSVLQRSLSVSPTFSLSSSPFDLNDDSIGEPIHLFDGRCSRQNEILPTRRSMIQDVILQSTLLSSMMMMTTTTMPQKDSFQAWAADENDTGIAIEPEITDKVFMDVRISRPDGTFAVRDDDTEATKVFKGRLVLGLFGKATPVHVERFLSYVNTADSSLDDRPYPSYARSSFKSFDQTTGVITGGTISSLEVTEFAGSTALQYGGRIVPASLWIEKNQSSSSQLVLPSSQRGLLIHKKLDATPTFGITTRSSTIRTELDDTHVAFGKIITDESSTEFLKIVESLPTYTVERPSTTSVLDKYDNNAFLQDAAKVVFDTQREIFRGAAKSFGDTRLAKVYPGKILRRVEVTQVGILEK